MAPAAEYGADRLRMGEPELCFCGAPPGAAADGSERSCKLFQLVGMIILNWHYIYVIMIACIGGTRGGHDPGVFLYAASSAGVVGVFSFPGGGWIVS